GWSYISNFICDNSCTACCHACFFLSVNSYGLFAMNKLIFPTVAIHLLNNDSFDISRLNITGTALFCIADSANLSIIALFPMLGRPPKMYERSEERRVGEECSLRWATAQ